MTPEAKQTIIELLAQVARQNGARDVGFDLRSIEAFFPASSGGAGSFVDASLSVYHVGRSSYRPNVTPSEDAKCVYGLWSQIVAAAKAMEAPE